MQGLAQQTPQSIAQAPVPQADHERKRRMKEAWKAYRGEFQPPLKIAKDQPDDSVITNFCSPIVDKGASWLFGQPIKIEATDEASTSSKESPIQDFLDGMWGDDDDCMTLLNDLGINGGVCGEAFLKIIPAQGQMKYPRIVVLDPMLVRIVTSPDDCSLILAYIVEYPGSNDMQKRQVIARIDPDNAAETAGEYDLDDTWTISNYVRKGQQIADWQLVGVPDTWPYPFAPIFCCPNLPSPNESWGTPDLTPDIIHQNKSLIFLLSNLSRIIKYHGHPKTWAKGTRASQISVGVDDMIVLDSPDAMLGTLNPMENFAGILSFVGNIMSNIDQQSRVPGVALGRQDQLPRLGNISGVALSLMFQPLIEKTTLKRRLYGKLIRDICRAALVVAGLIALESYLDYTINLKWPPLLPSDNLQAAQEALILQQLNVSMSTILAGLGLDADDEIAKKAVEDAKALTSFSRGQGMPPQQPPTPGVNAPMTPATATQENGPA